MKPLRSKRLGHQIKRELSNILLSEFRTRQPAMITITEVRMTPDLRQARIYYSVMGSRDDKTRAGKFLEKIKGHLRSQIATRITMRFHPHLEFRLDETLDYAQRIEDLIDETHRDHPTEQSPNEPETP
jgi:ribosome-binding factor A